MENETNIKFPNLASLVKQNYLETKIKVLSLNCSLLSAFFDLLPLKPNILGRAKKIGHKILTLAEEPDVVCLQEAFDTDAVAIIRGIIKDTYPHDFEDRDCGAFLVGANSGLVIFSKYPIIDTLLHTYEEATGDSFLSKKGIMGVKLQVKPDVSEEKYKNDAYAFIFTTHLQAGGINGKWYLEWVRLFAPDYSTNQIRLDQLREAKAEMFKFAGTSPSILIGDLNINSYDITKFIDRVSRKEIVVHEMIEDIFPNSATFNPDINGILYSIYNDKKRIDYAVNVGFSKAVSYLINHFTEDDTDHRGLICEF